jgi:hypothetical protein
MLRECAIKIAGTIFYQRPFIAAKIKLEYKS